MLVFLRFRTGQSRTLDVEPSDTIEDVKLKILEQEGIETNHQRLSFHAQPLEDHLTLAHYAVLKEATLDLDVGPPCSDTLTAGETLALNANATE
jgi:ubiquitin C